VRFLAWAVVLGIVAYLAWVLINHLSGQFRRIKRIYTPPPEIRVFQPGIQKAAL
jgi:hypothetical protein